MKAIKYFVYLNGDDRYDWFDDELDAIEYAQKNGNENTIINKNECEISDDGFGCEILKSEPVSFSLTVPEEEPVEVVDDDFDVDFPDIPEVDGSDDVDYDEMAKQYADEQALDTTPADWDDPNRFTEAVNKLEENENEVECKCCFELFPKESCVKTDKGYVCQKCNQELHSHQGTNLDLVDADPFDLNYDDPRDPEEVEEEEEVLDEPVNDDNEIRKHEAGIEEKLDEELKVITDFASYEPWSGAVDTYELIKDAGKLDDLEAYLEECFPEGITATQINDILWFEDKQLLKDLGISEEEDEEDEDIEGDETFEALDEYNSDTKSVYHYNCDPSGSEGDIEATSEKEARRKVEDILSAAGVYVPDEIIEITQNTGLAEHINDRPADIESDQENHGVDNAVVDCKKYTLVAHSEDEKPVDCKLEKPALEEPLAGEEVDVKLYEEAKEADPDFNAKLETEFNKRLDKYAPKFGYKDGAELKAAMEEDYDLYEEVIAYDDGDNFLDLYLHWWPDEEAFEAEDEYYHEPLRDVLAACLNENLQEAKKTVVPNLEAFDNDGETKPFFRADVPDDGSGYGPFSVYINPANKPAQPAKWEDFEWEVAYVLDNDGDDYSDSPYEQITIDECNVSDAEKQNFVDLWNACTVLDEGLQEAKKDEDELPPDPEVVKLEVHQELNNLVADEIEAIDGYEEVKADIIDKPIEHKDEIIDTINHIESEEKEHIDELVSVTTEIPFDKESDEVKLEQDERLADEANKEIRAKIEAGEVEEEPVIEEPVAEPVVEEELTEEKAKPAGDKKADYEAALKLAAANNKPVIYGYSNKSYNGKYFTLDNPIVCNNVFDETKKFKQKYKSCGTTYVAYPDDYEGLKESYRFSPEEQEKYNCDEDGCYEENGHWGRLVKCGWCEDFYDADECKFEVDFGWLCSRCQDELQNHGGPLMFVEPAPRSCDEEDELEANLHKNKA